MVTGTGPHHNGIPPCREREITPQPQPSSSHISVSTHYEVWRQKTVS